ncbi:FUSC family protein [Streptomyces sp. NPDC090108]|uniref:FUSC family protein n=1 Tax=Streptomyces sp. NPDC090108 TaxID=3365947 RepID=UPI003810C6F4
MPKSREDFSQLIAGLTRVLSPRGSFAMAKISGALPFALRAAVTMALPTLPLVLAGRPDLALFPALGAFTITFERSLPPLRRRRLWLLGIVALAMTAAVGLGSLLAVWAGPSGPWFQGVAAVAGMAAVAGLAKFGCDYAGLRGLGAVLMLFSFAVTAEAPTQLSQVLPHTALTALGAAVAWLMCLPNSLQPRRLRLLALADALQAFSTALDAVGPSRTSKARRQALAAALRAHYALNDADVDLDGPQDGEDAEFSADYVWALLTTDAWQSARGAALSRHLREQARHLAERRWHLLKPLPHDLRPRSSRAGGVPAADGAPTADAEEPPPASASVAPASHAPAGVPRPKRSGAGRRRAAALLPNAVRTAVGTGAAGGLALFLGVGHSYWAAISAAAVLHSVSAWSTVQRSVQRTLGTAIGLLLTAAALVPHPGPVPIICMIIVCEFFLEYLVARNYGLGVVFLTPLALLLSELHTPISADQLLHDRVVGSAIGICVGLAAALLLVHNRAAARLRDALTACAREASRAEHALYGSLERRRVAQVHLAAALVDLYEARDAATGELKPTRVDPAAVADVEDRAYDVLSRLSQVVLQSVHPEDSAPPSGPEAPAAGS